MSAGDLIKFWQLSAEKDLAVAEDNLRLGHYHYDDIKQSFCKKATREYAQKWADKCRRYFKWLRQ